MNHTFNIQRFGRLWVKYYTDYGRQYLWTLAFLLVLPTALWTVIGSMSTAGLLTSTLVCFLALSGLIFKDFDRRGSAIGAVMLPASVLEKYLFLFLNLLAVGAAIFLVFWLDIRVGEAFGWFTYNQFNWGTLSAQDQMFCILWPLFLHASLLCSKIVFRRRVILGFLVLVAYGLLLTRLFIWIPQLGGIELSYPISGNFSDLGLTISSMAEQADAKLFYSVSIFDLPVRETLGWILAWLQVVVLWVVSYFKLKESQIR